MLKMILSVSGKPGLFKLVSNAKNMVIVESLADKRRLPIYARDKVVSLGDIAMYTDNEEVPLSKVLATMKDKENGAKASISPSSKPEELRKYFAGILPDYDRDRVYDSDIKKLINWYNILIESGLPFLEEEQEEKPTEEASPEVKEAATEDKKTTPKTKTSAKKADKTEALAEKKPAAKKKPATKTKKNEE